MSFFGLTLLGSGSCFERVAVQALKLHEVQDENFEAAFKLYSGESEKLLDATLPQVSMFADRHFENDLTEPEDLLRSHIAPLAALTLPNRERRRKATCSGTRSSAVCSTRSAGGSCPRQRWLPS